MKKQYIDYKKEGRDTEVYEPKDVKDFEPMLGEKLATFRFIKARHSHMVGKMLTIVDACLVDKDQKKAAKDLVRNAVSDELDFLSNILFDQEEMQKAATEAYDEAVKNGREMESVDVLEALDA